MGKASVTLLVLCLFLGCSTFDSNVSAKNEGELGSKLKRVSVPTAEQHSLAVQKSESQLELREVSRPIAQGWLLNPYQAVFKDISAKRALELALPDQALRFDLALEQIPRVSVKSSPFGTLNDVVDAICLHADWLCEFDGGTLVVKDLETRDFAILAQPGLVNGELSVNSLDSAEGSEFNDGEAVTLESVNPYVDELEPLIAGLLELDELDGVPVQQRLLPRANAVVVTARPSTLGKVAEVIELYNDRTAKLVRVFLTVYEVALNAKQSIGSRLAAVRLGSKLASVFGWSTRPVQSDGVFQFSVTDPDSVVNGSNLMLEWLESEGDASVSLTDQLDVRNNRIASSSSTRTFQYVASITRELDNLGRERTEVKRAQLKTGWAITVHPTIGVDTVTVRLSLARRALVEERPFAFGDTSGTNFVTDDQNRSMSVTLKDGESRIITMLSSLDERSHRQKLAGLITRKGLDKNHKQSVILMRVELI